MLDFLVLCALCLESTVFAPVFLRRYYLACVAISLPVPSESNSERERELLGSAVREGGASH